MATAGILRSALYVDFDNIYSGLYEEDPDAARAFANSPTTWSGRLRQRQVDPADEREFLIRRCYLNPRGSHPSEPSVSYGTYRDRFTRAGFEVIDCPSLTSNNKNAADIRVALDIFELVLRGTVVEEFVIATADSDITPLLYRLSAHGKRSFLISASRVAAACSSAATSHLGGTSTLRLILPERPEAPVLLKPSNGTAKAGTPGGSRPANGSSPVAVTVNEAFGPTAPTAPGTNPGSGRGSGPAPAPASGAGSTAVPPPPRLQRSMEAADTGTVADLDQGVVPALVRAEVPPLSSAQWSEVIHAIATCNPAGAKHVEIAKAIYVDLAERGSVWPVRHLAEVLRLCQAGGLPPYRARTATAIVEAIERGIEVRCTAVGSPPSAADLDGIRLLLRSRTLAESLSAQPFAAPTTPAVGLEPPIGASLDAPVG